jgi:type IV secretion system protein VirD4
MTSGKKQTDLIPQNINPSAKTFLEKNLPSSEELKALIKSPPAPERKAKTIIFIIGAILTPLTFAGILLGYVRGYNRIMKPANEYPRFSNLSPTVKFSMIVGGLIVWLSLLFLIILPWIFDFDFQVQGVALIWLGVNFLLCTFVYVVFRRWRNGVTTLALENSKYGTAKFAADADLKEFRHGKGFYIGGAYTFNGKGHILTVAGTRGGKGVNLLIPNLLGLGGYDGSWVVIDPKGENAAITARSQRHAGSNVVILNPWGLLEDSIGKASSYNPLDILSDRTSIHLVDDVAIIAEMLVAKGSEENSFFTDNARSIISTLLLYLVCLNEDEFADEKGFVPTPKTLTTIWKWLRMSGKQWEQLLTDIRKCNDEYNGLAIRTGGDELLKLMQSGERTFGSIMATCLQSTAFLNSPSLQNALQSGFNPAQLADRNTALYVIIPADKLQSHSRWLRLVVTSAMRCVIRKPKNRVVFLLDEFAALGYISEIETALSTYAGYNVTVWAILQSLVQLKNLYKENWESFTANTTVKQYFSVNDNFSADYISHAIGTTSNVTYRQSFWGEISDIQTNQRKLITSDELRRHSGENMFMFVGDKPPVIIKKHPYYLMNQLKGRYDENPYFKKEPNEIVPISPEPSRSEEPELVQAVETEEIENTPAEETEPVSNNSTFLSNDAVSALIEYTQQQAAQNNAPPAPKPRYRYNSETGKYEVV